MLVCKTAFETRNWLKLSHTFWNVSLKIQSSKSISQKNLRLVFKNEKS